MSSTADQTMKRKQTLLKFHQDVRSVVKKHKLRMISLVKEADAQKKDLVHRKIQEV